MIEIKQRTLTVPLLVLLIGLIGVSEARGQIQIGTVKGAVADERAAVLANVEVTLENPLSGYRAFDRTDGQGRFAFNNVPLAAYRLRVVAGGFAAEQRELSVRSNLPLTIELTLKPAGVDESAQINAGGDLARSKSSSTQVELDASFIQTIPRVVRNRQLQKLVASAPGVASDSNGLLHVRGVD